MSNEPEMVAVRICGTMTVHLDQTIRILRQTFDRLNALWEQEDGLGVDEAEPFLDLLDLASPASVDYDDVDTFEAVEPAPAE